MKKKIVLFQVDPAVHKEFKINCMKASVHMGDMITKLMDDFNKRKK